MPKWIVFADIENASIKIDEKDSLDEIATPAEVIQDALNALEAEMPGLRFTGIKARCERGEE